MSELNEQAAAEFAQGLADSGLRLVCISPGSRSGPLAIAFARHPSLQTWTHVDERSSGFFALGLAKRSGDPVVVLTTSGTAAAELHPAVLEAHHSRTPLVVVTADRPPEGRDSGANQTTDQRRLFGDATRWSADPGPPDGAQPPWLWYRIASRAVSASTQPVAGPVHVNLAFREPLLGRDDAGGRRSPAERRPLNVHAGVRTPSEGAIARLVSLIEAARRPFIHVGSLPAWSAQESLAPLTARSPLVVHAEPTSQLRRPDISGLVTSTESLLREERFASAHAPDLVIRIGAAPTSRVTAEWLLDSRPKHVVLLDPDGSWLDPAYLATEVIQADLGVTLRQLAERVRPGDGREWQAEWLEADRRGARAVERALDTTPLFEAHAVRALAHALPAEATVVVGSSLPVRDVDWFWPPDKRRFVANRGLSGIDGFASTALGAAAAGTGEPIVALCGDLTLYHDMNGLLAASKHGRGVTFVVLNNCGGGIFAHMPESQRTDVFDSVFATPIGLDFAKVADLYGLAYAKAEHADALPSVIAAALGEQGSSLIEVHFSREASVSGHRTLWAAASSAIRAAPGSARET